MANDISISVKVSNQSAPGLASVAASLQTLKDQAQAAARALVDMHAAAHDVRLTASLDDQTAAGLLSVRHAVQELQDQSPIRLSVVFNGGSSQITAASGAFDALKNVAQDAGDSLRTLRTRARAAAAALGDLRDNALTAAAALRTLNTHSGITGSRFGDLTTRTRTLRSDMDDLDGALTRAGGRLGGLRGTLGGLRSSSDDAGGGMQNLLGAAISLAPALIPIAASLGPIAVSAAAAGAAVGVFGAALAGQVKGLTDMGAAQEKFDAAVTKYGATSKQAAQAQDVVRESLGKLPPATRQAAAALLVAKDNYKAWSNALSADTMPVVTKGLGIFSGMLGKLSPLVKTSSTELGKMETILAGGMQSPGFDRFVDKVNKLAGTALQKVTTSVTHLAEALSTGKADGAIGSFMTYARDNGPLVSDTLRKLAEAVENIVHAAADAGPGMLTLVNALAGLVAAVPTQALTALISLYSAFKLLGVASAGLSAAGTRITGFRTQLTALRATATAAGGGLAGLQAAFASLSTGAKVGIAVAAVAALVVAMHELSGNTKAPIVVDQLSSSLNTLAQTGKVTGSLKTNFNDLSLSIAMVSKSASDNKIGTMVSDFGSWIGISTGPGISKAKENVDAWDKSMANLVAGGKPEQAAAQFAILKKAWIAGGGDVKRLNKVTDDYHSALADQAFQTKMAAQSMGLFGDQAQQVQTKLDAQKQSADGLRQSIQALNDVNRAALGDQSAFEAAIDAGTKALKENGRALSMHNGQLDLNSEKARNEEAALTGIASSTDAYAASVRDSGGSWIQVKGIYDRGRQQIVDQGQAMGLTKSQADQLADRILKMPKAETFFKGNIDDLSAKIKTAQKRVDSLKQKRKTAVGADKASLDKQVRAAQRTVDALKQKRAVALRASNQTGPGVAAAKRSIDSVHGKTVNIFANVTGPRPGGLGFAHGGIVGAASGGPRSGMTLVGEQGPELVDIAPGSRVHSNPDTKRMLAGGTAGDGGGQPIIVQLQLDGHQIAEVLIDPLRKKVRNLGGPTATFGKDR